MDQLSPANARQLAINGYKQAFQHLGTGLYLSITPVALAVLTVVLAFHTQALTPIPMYIALFSFLFSFYVTLPFTSIQFVQSGEIGHNITGHTTKGMSSYCQALFKQVIIFLSPLILIIPISFLIFSETIPRINMFAIIFSIILLTISLVLFKPFAVIYQTSSLKKYRKAMRTHKKNLVVRKGIRFMLPFIMFKGFFLGILMSPFGTKALANAVNKHPGIEGFSKFFHKFTILAHKIVAPLSEVSMLWWIVGVSMIVLLICLGTFVASNVSTRLVLALKGNPKKS
jgi:hypothetical protein